MNVIQTHNQDPDPSMLSNTSISFIVLHVHCEYDMLSYCVVTKFIFISLPTVFFKKGIDTD